MGLVNKTSMFVCVHVCVRVGLILDALRWEGQVYPADVGGVGVILVCYV